mmetsp:Transcript_13775/g.19739  ORF Transcript_13775/g.19739 Transcript_13775/m.19739 type:complete len:173 (-) Transcript_13775:126-644(-)|eukprot:CAMPEP_0172429214 /NCGR_PEP_ID=MMETSP1064-20121228/49483_1 /TAXON_ID=202472 /ORGANISM="Aulacoseira subarctica , Strain CCAP 1002/5" /LENGTH=172 /DNA_ID=CAMNT_0013174469 /DNA_START=261 /DNA_END=779 /DNA_ORIENTATION=+
MMRLTSFAMVLFSASFVESSSTAIQTLTSHAGNLRKTEFKDAVADTIENLQAEDEVFWKRALSMSTDLAFFDTSAVDSGSCGNRCSSDSDCDGICKTCYGIVAKYHPTGNCGSQGDDNMFYDGGSGNTTIDGESGNTLTITNGSGSTDSTDNVDEVNEDGSGNTVTISNRLM